MTQVSKGVLAEDLWNTMSILTNISTPFIVEKSLF